MKNTVLFCHVLVYEEYEEYDRASTQYVDLLKILIREELIK